MVNTFYFTYRNTLITYGNIVYNMQIDRNGKYNKSSSFLKQKNKLVIQSIEIKKEAKNAMF